MTDTERLTYEGFAIGDEVSYGSGSLIWTVKGFPSYFHDGVEYVEILLANAAGTERQEDTPRRLSHGAPVGSPFYPQSARAR